MMMMPTPVEYAPWEEQIQTQTTRKRRGCGCLAPVVPSFRTTTKLRHTAIMLRRGRAASLDEDKGNVLCSSRDYILDVGVLD